MTKQNTNLYMEFIRYKEHLKSLEELTETIIGDKYDDYYGIFLDIFDNENFDIDTLSNALQGVKLDILGAYYFWFEHEHEQALDCWMNVLEKSNTDVLYYLGYYYLTQKKDYEQATEYLKKSVDVGDPRAMCVLGIYHEIITHDYEQSIKYHLMAIEQNYTPSMNSLGTYYNNIKHDEEQAVHYYLMAIERENVDAIYNLGKYYEKKCDYVQAVKYFMMGTKAGHAKSMYSLGLYYGNIDIDYDKAKYYFSLAVEKSHREAMFALGLLYYCENDYDQALKYYLMAVENNYEPVWNCLGLCYIQVKNYEQAVKYFLMAIGGGSVDAMHRLGLYYLNVEKNYEQAIKYLQMALSNGSTAVMQNLGKYYLENNDLEKAKYYWIMAVSNGHFSPLDILAVMFKHHDTHLYGDLFTVCQGILSNAKSPHKMVEYLSVLVVSPRVNFVLWKVLNKLIYTTEFDKDVHDFLKSLESTDTMFFKEREEMSLVLKQIDTCPICLEPDQSIIKINCDHGVCYQCWEPSMKCFYRCNV